MANTGNVSIDNIMLWYKKHYKGKKYSFALREYLTKSIIKNGIRYKVIGIYPDKIDGLYFIVHSSVPIKEKLTWKVYFN